MRTIPKRTISQRRDDAGRQAAPAERDRALDAAELDHVASAGGRTCNSSNPVED
jgi:hypothetical protein